MMWQVLATGSSNLHYVRCEVQRWQGYAAKQVASPD